MLRRRRTNMQADINIVSFLDILLVLLIIFMVTAPLMTNDIKLNLPHGNTHNISQKTSKSISLVVDANGVVYWENKVVSLKDIQKYLSKFDHSTTIYLKADRQTKYQSIISVMSLLSREKFYNIVLVTIVE